MVTNHSHSDTAALCISNTIMIQHSQHITFMDVVVFVASEKVVGWYSTGPKLRSVDLSIHELFRSYCAHPILVIIDVNPLTSPLEIPTLAYISIEASPNQMLTTRRQFQHLPSEIGAYEAEEVGVEHLLRNIKDNTESSLIEQIHSKMISLKSFTYRLYEIHTYLNHS